jgi:hypothetical protein
MARLTDQVWNADAAELKRLAARLRLAHALVHSTFRDRESSRAAWAAWSAAAAELHQVRSAFYDEDGPDTRAQDVRRGNRDAVEKAVRFLEVGPRFFHSGYAKERLIRSLKKAPLTAAQVRRLRIALSRTLDEGGRELAVWLQLAPRLDIEQVRRAVMERSRSSEPSVRRRAEWARQRLDSVVLSQQPRRKRTG